ncbi:AAO2 [Symbiodinium sp. CCMP2592]|nr:AAO2 [Symbiodinium sp. CCMP2592]
MVQWHLVPAGCTVELALEVPAPKVTGAVVYDFVFRSSEGQLINENLSLVLDIRDEPEERRALAHPNLGIFPGAHTRKIYFGAAPALTNTEPAAVEPPKVRSERTEETEWALLSRTRLDALPDYLAKRFGRPGEATVRFWVNGEEQVINSGQFPLTMNLAEYMRYHAGLPGTKIGCGEGGCGACTVLLRRGDLLSLKAAPVLCNACLRPLHSMNGYEVTTVEEVGTPEKPHAIQSAIAKHSASQCGMCTPGMVMALYGHLAKGGSREPQAIEGCIQGNLCRCTGYRPIHDAMKDAASRPDCTANVGEIKDAKLQSSVLSRDGQLWLNCTALADVFPALTYAAALPHRLVVGNTSTGVIKYYPPHPNDHPTVFINVQNVGEMKAIEHSATSLTLGAACTLSTMIEEIDKATAAAPQLAAIVRHLKLVAHPQVRDVGSWAGNVMIAKTHPDFPSDVCLLLTTLGAELKLMDEDRKIQSVDIVTFLSDAALPRGGAKPQIIHSVTIPFPGANTYLDTFKIMRRHMNTHAELNAGFLFQFAADGGVGVSDVRMVFGNVEHKPFIADGAIKALRGQPLTSATIQSIGKVLRAEIEAHIQGPSVPEPPFLVVDKEYRVNLACNLFAKAALRGRQARGAVLTPEELSAATAPERMESTGDQKFTVDPATAPIGQPLEKFQALDQACGTAQYVADEPIRPRTLFGVPVLAEKVAVVKCIDVVECMEVAGVTNFISAADVKELGAENDMKPTCPSKIFADTTEPTKHVAQFVGMVLADTLEAARCGARLVHVEYAEDTEQAEPVVKVADALRHGKVQERHGPLSVGKARGAADVATVEGKLSSAGQKHFYLETQTTYAYPDGMGGLVVNSSCQTLDWAQTMLCKIFHLPKSKVTVQNQRIGGAYGGKAMLFAPVCAATAVAAMRTKRPVMVQLDRTPDFRSLGARAPFEASWSCSYDVSSGKIGSLKQDILQNVGFDMLGFSQASSVNCYDIPHAQLHCKGAVTDLPCNTWMRAPGDFEGAIIMEAIMEQVARAAQKEPWQLQEANLAPGMVKAWQALKAKSNFDMARAATKAFNEANRYRKRGIYCMGSRYKLPPAQWTERCYLRINTDGSVVLEHSGLEVGQGLDTKALQALTMELKKIAADFTMDKISIRMPKSTADFSWAGITGTYGSCTSETVVSAILDAGGKLQKELAPYITAGKPWTQVVSDALKAGATLYQEGKTSVAKEPLSDYDLFSAGCAQVEIDVLTGETQVRSFDVIYDCGKSLNPAVDIGQIEGCVIQALGFGLLEEENRRPDGGLINCGTWEYKVPSGQDIPVRFTVELLPCEDPTAPVMGSKASGEPAMLLGGATFFAVKDAIGYARADMGLSREFRLDPPASPDRIQAACGTKMPS